jgi:hypothetical protein
MKGVQRLFHSHVPRRSQGWALITLAVCIMPCHAGVVSGATFSPTNVTPPDLAQQLPKINAKYTLDPANHIEGALFGSLGGGPTYSFQHCGKYVHFVVDPTWNRIVALRNDSRSLLACDSPCEIRPNGLRLPVVVQHQLAAAPSSRLQFSEMREIALFLSGRAVTERPRPV